MRSLPTCFSFADLLWLCCASPGHGGCPALHLPAAPHGSAPCRQGFLRGWHSCQGKRDLPWTTKGHPGLRDSQIHLPKSSLDCWALPLGAVPQAAGQTSARGALQSQGWTEAVSWLSWCGQRVLSSVLHHLRVTVCLAAVTRGRDSSTSSLPGPGWAIIELWDGLCGKGH